MITSSHSLYDQNTFYPAVLRDIRNAGTVVIIESPFLTKRRVDSILPELNRLIRRKVRVILNTKPFEEHQGTLLDQAIESVAALQDVGVEVYMTVGHHRKLIFIDNRIMWEGSLNMLSQNDSCEFMRRIDSEEDTMSTIKFLRLDRSLKLHYTWGIYGK